MLRRTNDRCISLITRTEGASRRDANSRDVTNNLDRANPPNIRSTTMNDQFTRQAQDMLNAAKDARIPENVQAMAEEGVLKTREAYVKMSAVAKDGAKVIEDVMLAGHAGAKAIGEKVMHNTMVNTEAAFDAALAMARAKTLPEVARLQANFWQQQFAIANAQTKELFDLSTKVSKQTFESVNAATQKSFEQMKKAG